jgi:DNA-binding transcriptional MerR regulator
VNVSDGSPGSLISIGEFSRRTRLTIKALRIYHEAGLLCPAVVEDNGYRRYDHTQIARGQLIGLLRGADLSLSEISNVLDDLDVSVDLAVQSLERLLAARDRQHDGRKLLIRHIQAALREGDDPMFEIQTRHVPACRVMSIQRRLRAPETDDFVQEAKTTFARHLGGAKPTGPFMLIFHGPVSDESDGPLEAVLGCPDQIQPTDVIGVRTEPAHDEAYTVITKAQWEYPAILGAYDAVARSREVSQRPHSRLSCREVYRAAPESIGDDEFICDVAYPLA